MIISKSPYAHILRRLKKKIFAYLTINSMKLFVRGGDHISVQPLIFGSWDEDLVALSKYYAAQGLDEFYLDIGANIGLTACQNGGPFRHIWCIEPNPLCFKVLGINMAVTYDKSKYTLLNFALGDENKLEQLYVPKNNWGGAFIKNSNYYEANLLAEKDGFYSFNSDNYHLEQIVVKDAQSVFKKLFGEVLQKNLVKGFVKIDTEGYDQLILSALSEILPDSFKLAIVFENLNSDLKVDELKKFFKGRKTSIKSLIGSYEKHPKLLQYLFGLLGIPNKKLLSILDNKILTVPSGNIIIEVI